MWRFVVLLMLMQRACGAVGFCVDVCKLVLPSLQPPAFTGACRFRGMKEAWESSGAFGHTLRWQRPFRESLVVCILVQACCRGACADHGIRRTLAEESASAAEGPEALPRPQNLEVGPPSPKSSAELPRASTWYCFIKFSDNALATRNSWGSPLFGICNSCHAHQLINFHSCRSVCS